ncbi:hypothetical protein [Aquibacillus saliphilus]|uniref:hypothetical protein n=1 Tax=Aquibacillus saliphilus TaxID=1909422 RepID=UPI001CF05EC8|nr:hypothetical protein [Aquibacillus saliphilus]
MENIFYGEKVERVFSERREYSFMGGGLGFRQETTPRELDAKKLRNPENYLSCDSEFIEYVEILKTDKLSDVINDNHKVEFKGNEYEITKTVVDPEKEHIKYFIDYKIVVDDDTDSKTQVIESIREDAINRFTEELDYYKKSFNQRHRLASIEQIAKLGDTISVLSEWGSERYKGILTKIQDDSITLATYNDKSKVKYEKVAIDGFCNYRFNILG